MDHGAHSALFSQALQNAKHTVYAHQVLCSVLDEMMSSSATATSPLAILLKENKSGSLHRDVVCGSLTRLHYVEGAPISDHTVPLLRRIVAHLYAARQSDSVASSALRAWPGHTENDENWRHLAQQWNDQRVHWLRETARSLRTVVPNDVWVEGKDMSSQTYTSTVGTAMA
ncbi:MAG: hypothetical protein OWS03_05730 [Alicyclobacillaceae bacterium]|nr:hypothetical protein [Alicyclobacillaceae bacterium]